MTRKRSRESRDLCAHLFDDDRFDDRPSRSHPDLSSSFPSRKDAQLCKQVLRAVRDALAASCLDPDLDEVELLDAVPAPRISRIRIRALAPEGRESATRVALLRVEGLLRAAVAAAITRKRTPSLLFTVTTKGADPDGTS